MSHASRTTLPIVPATELPAGCSLSLGIKETLTLVVPFSGTTRPALITEVDPLLWDDDLVARCVRWVQEREAAVGITPPATPPLQLLD